MNSFLLCCALWMGADTPEPPVADPILFPVPFGNNRVESRGTVLQVSKGVYYIIEAKVDCLPLCSPEKAVTFTNLRAKFPTGPVILGGRFAQNPADEQEKQFDSPFIFKVEPGTLGDKTPETAEIIFVTKGDNQTVERRTVSLKAPKPPPKDEEKKKGDSPTSLKGVHVLIGEETSKRTKLSASQSAIFTSVALQEFLNENCVTESATSAEVTKAWRIYDKDVQLKNEVDWVKTVMSRKHDSDFWIYVSNGTTWEESPLPKSIAEVKALVNKYKVEK